MVRSLDVQQVLLQSSTVERVQQVQQQQADVQQNHFGGQLAEEQRALREKVKDLAETERLMIKEKEEREKKERKRNRTKREKEDIDDTACDLSADKHVGKVDIRI